MSRVGSKVEKLRIERGLTRKQLAKSVGVSEKYIEEIETGKKVLSDDLLKRVCKVLEIEISQMALYEGGDSDEPKKAARPMTNTAKAEIQDVWGDAFSSLLKAVPVYDYTLTNAADKKLLPVVANKIEGFSKEKVLFLVIEDDDMSGFRIMKGDVAFGYSSGEIENNSVCLLEYNGQRRVRQVKKLDKDRILLVYNRGSLITDTVSAKELKILARLVRVEIKL